MAPYYVRPTSIDQTLAEQIGATSRPAPEEIAEILTWAADEHVLLGCAAVVWCVATIRRSRLQAAANHLVLVTAASVVLPHALKLAFDQVRPDRRTVLGHFRGIPLSGDAMDAFPSGHALHMGALASAASVLPKAYRRAVWITTIGLSGTRVVILAHWLSDVIAGFAMGVALERGLRQLTRYPDRFVRRFVSKGNEP